MKYKIYDKVICVVECESIAQRFNRKGDQSRKIKRGEIFTVYGMNDIGSPIFLSLQDGGDSRVLARVENFIPLEYWRQDQINKLLR
jgi:hypothetical protein